MKIPRFSKLAEEILKQRYLKPKETPREMFERVSSWVAQPEQSEKDKWQKIFFNTMNNLEFLPNSPCLMNAGTSMPQLAACFVYPIEDDLESIFETLKVAALTHKSGGGTGFSFSRLRPNGDKVGMTGGTTSGPVSFMEVYDKATEAIRQGGKRRGANMGILRIDHPDIMEFIDAKIEEHKLNNFNISVTITDKFMRSLTNSEEYGLFFPPHGKLRGTISAEIVFDKIVQSAWKNGEPGIIFIDKINRKNPLKELGDIEATNPCGEAPLLPYEACILGSINLAAHIKEKKVDWKKLEETIKTGVRFLDNAIDVSDFPLKEIYDMVKQNRKIGLGIMGFASMLIKLEIPYASIGGIRFGRNIMKFINNVAHRVSEELAEKKGEFLNFYRSELRKKRRNSFITTIAPTGSIAILAGVSSGIEPVYALVGNRRTEAGKSYTMVLPEFEEILNKYKLNSKKIMDTVYEKGSISTADNVPDRIKNILLTATEIDPRMHVLMQAAFQKHVDNAISKTINLPENFTIDKVKNIIKIAYRTGCKGITIYRQHSRTQQVLDIVCDCEDEV